MNIPLHAHTLAGEQIAGVRIDRYPDTCPLCHTHVLPKLCFAVAASGKPTDQVHLAFQCTSNNCELLFVASYGLAQDGTFQFKSAAPKTPQRITFPEIIESLSQTYVEVRHQAAAAETYGLDQIVGIGLRKALEFLIKDYLVARVPAEEREAILGTPLGACIGTYVADQNIKECAKRAAWLGNDETHYLRRWEDKDIGDLKALIRLTENWIENALLTQKYIRELHEQ